MVRTPRSLCLCAVLAALVALLAPGAASAAQTRYSLVHGCYALKAANGRALTAGAHARMQATALGRYLLYRPDGKFLAAEDNGTVKPADEPSPAADWTVRPAGANRFTLSPQSDKGKVLAVQADGTGKVIEQRDLRGEAELQTANCGRIRFRSRRAKSGFGKALAELRDFLAVVDGPEVRKLVA